AHARADGTGPSGLAPGARYSEVRCPAGGCALRGAWRSRRGSGLAVLPQLAPCRDDGGGDVEVLPRGEKRCIDVWAAGPSTPPSHRGDRKTSEKYHMAKRQTGE